MKRLFLPALLAACVVCTLTAILFGDIVQSSEENYTIHTAAAIMAVNQTSRVASQLPGLGFKYFADSGDTCYMFDGSLIIGTSANDLSMGIYTDTTSPNGHADPFIGRLYSLSETTLDTMSMEPFWGYRHAYGIGCNRDSSIAFDADFYAPQHIDSGNFMIGKFSLYAGPKNPNATINNVTVCYAADWDIPDALGQNQSGYDETLEMVYQQGVNGADVARFGALAGLRGDDQPIWYGMVLDNPSWVDRLNCYVHDTLWAKIQSMTDYDYFVGAPTDLNSILVFTKTAQIKPKAQGVFTVYVIFAGQPRIGGSFSGMKDEVRKAQKFICTYLDSTALFCGPPECCGDVNGDGAIDISDAVFMISYVYGGGAPPEARCGNVDGCGEVTVADAFYLEAVVGGTLPPVFTGCENANPCSTEVAGEVEIGCPPYEVYPGGDSIAVPVLVSTIYGVHDLCLGFKYDSDSISITSVVDPWQYPEQGSLDVLFRPASKEVRLIAHLNHLDIWPIGLSDLLLCKLNVRILHGDPQQVVRLDTAFVAPGGEWLFWAPNRPHYRPVLTQGPCCNMCGDANNDDVIDISDPVFIIARIFGGGEFPDCVYVKGKGDANGDQTVDISDAVYLIEFIFSGGSCPHCYGLPCAQR